MSSFGVRRVARILAASFAIALAVGTMQAANEAVSASGKQVSAAVLVRGNPKINLTAKGNHWKLLALTGSHGGRVLDGEAVYQIQGRTAILDAPIPEVVRQLLLKDTDAPDEESLYIVHKSTAERVRLDAHGALTLAAPVGSAGAGSSGSVDEGHSSGLDCDDPFGWGNTVSQKAGISFNLGGAPISLTLEDQAVGSKSAPGLHLSGKLKARFPLRAELSGSVKVKVLEVACAPVALKLKYIRVQGSFDVRSELSLDAQIGVTQTFRARVVTEPLGGFLFFVGPIPVYLGCDAYLDATIEFTAPNLVQVAYSATGEGKGSIDLKCTTGTCSGTQTFEHHWHDKGDATFAAQGIRAVIKPGLEGGLVAYVNDPEFIKAYFAVRPYLQSDVWAATSGQCQTPGVADDGPAVALTMDLDSGLDVVAGVDTFLPGLAKEFELYSWQEHLKFIDLVGSTALTPVVHVNPPTTAGAAETFTVRMRSCYPYTDKVNYQLGFGDEPGGKAGSYWGSPSGAQTSHTYAAEGSFALNARALGDKHGRNFKSPATVVPLVVAAATSSRKPASITTKGAPTGATSSAAQSGSGKKTKSSGGGLSTIDPKSVPVSASESGTTALAIRGMTAPQEARVTSVDAAGIMTLTSATGAARRFALSDRAQMKRVAVGQRVWFDAAAGQLSLDGAALCCAITPVSAGRPLSAKPTTAAKAVR